MLMVRPKLDTAEETLAEQGSPCHLVHGAIGMFQNSGIGGFGK